MSASAVTNAPVRPGDTELFPYRLAISGASALKADWLVVFGALGDFCMVLAGLVLGYWVRFESGLILRGNEPIGIRLWDYAGLIGLGSLFLMFTFGYLQLYNPRKIPGFRNTLAIIFKGTTFWLFAFLGLTLVMRLQPTISRGYMMTSYVACLTSVLAWRWIYSRILQTKVIARALRKRVLFVGSTAEANRMVRMINQDPAHPFDLVGWIPPSADRREATVPLEVPELNQDAGLQALLHQHEIDMVILADPRVAYEEIVALSNLCEKELIEFKIIPSYFQILISGLKLEPISGVPVLGVTELPLNRLVNRILKRATDVVGALVGLLLSTPILVVFGTLIRLESPGSIFFAQDRIGRNGRSFKMYKLRTMRPDAGDTDHINQSTLRDDPRLLRVGKFMRRWNLDEVPQFWNVLKGEMSLVGPRPERVYHSRVLSGVIPHYNARLASKPGLTGWAQVNGLRGDTSLEERIRYDLHYLENWSWWFDLQTMAQTFFRRENAY